MGMTLKILDKGIMRGMSDALRNKNIFDLIIIMNFFDKFNHWYLEGDERLTIG